MPAANESIFISPGLNMNQSVKRFAPAGRFPVPGLRGTFNISSVKRKSFIAISSLGLLNVNSASIASSTIATSCENSKAALNSP